jgi:hypothetical protein
LQIMQLVQQLNELPWLKAPVTKDLVKMDIEHMRHTNQVKRHGASRCWRLPTPEEA